jgi:fatty acid desaturase
MIPFDFTVKVSLLHVTVTFGASYPAPAPGNCDRSGNSPLSCPQMTEAAAVAVAVVDVVIAALVVVLAIVVLVEVVLVVAVLAVVVVVRRAAFFTLASEEEELDPQADTRTSPERTKQESKRFCIPLLCIMYTINTTHPGAKYLI